MDIVQYIKEQLFTDQEVVIPGFGKFSGERKAAYIEKDKVYPPSKVITFVRDTKATVINLAVYISKKERISEDEAIKAISSFVTNSNQRLESGNTVIFEGIGIVTPLEEGKIGFKQSHQSNLLPETYGMEAVPLVAMDKKVAITPRKRESLIWMWLLLTIALISLLLVAGWWFFIKNTDTNTTLNTQTTHVTTNRTTSTVNNTSTVNESKTDSAVANSSTTYKSSETDVNTVPEKLNPKDAESVEETFQTHLQNKKFIYLIVGSFKAKDNAIKLQKSLKSSSYESEILNTDTGFYRVTLGKFPNADAATKILNEYADAHPQSEIWAL